MTNTTRVEREIVLDDIAEATALLGPFNRNLKAIRDRFDVKANTRGDRLIIQGDEADVDRVLQLIDKLQDLIRQDHVPDLGEVEYLVEQVRSDEDVDEVLDDVIGYTHWGEPLRAKTRGQARYLEAMREHEIVFGIGPSGTGKTYLAVANAVKHLREGYVNRLILTRPAVEAGEELGFLPGDVQEKVTPYLRPLYDALFDLIPAEDAHTYIANGRIEIAPLAYMRGRTLNNSFVILDEAQNTTPGQMKMFLTRLGLNSRVVVTGDITQIDLQKGTSGLVQVKRILEPIEEIVFIELEKSDVVRHPLVKKIIDAYEKAETS